MSSFRTKLIVDVSSVLKTGLFVGRDAEFGKDVEFEGKVHHCPSAVYGFDNALAYMIEVFKATQTSPNDTILVVEGGNSTVRRKHIYGGYKAARAKRPELVNLAFREALEMFTEQLRLAGATVVTQMHVEADDTIAYLVRKTKGVRCVVSNDGDMATLLAEPGVFLFKSHEVVAQNIYGAFHPKFIPLMKSLVGDGNEYKGAAGFGKKAWENLLVQYGDYLDNLESLIVDRKLHELESDVDDFKPFRKVIDGAAHVYESYECALLHDDWVNTTANPIKIGLPAAGTRSTNFSLSEFTSSGEVHLDHLIHRDFKHDPSREFMVFDTELIGNKSPWFLACAKNLATGETHSWWGHVAGDMKRLRDALENDRYTWVSFNGRNFDAPILGFAVRGATSESVLCERDLQGLKDMACEIIERDASPLSLPKMFNYEPLRFDHIDISEVAPGVRISLKAYAGRLAYPTMMDMPFEHDTDVGVEKLPTIEKYCFNDIGVTEALFKELQPAINTRVSLSKEHDLDLRSLSDAQVAENVLRKVLGITGKVERSIPRTVSYKAPDFIKTDSEEINALIKRLEGESFKINFANGSPVAPEWMSTPLQLGYGSYKVGLGGLHSTHDVALHKCVTEHRAISDYDVASFYPCLMMFGGIRPKFDGNAALAEKFLTTYTTFYNDRVAAKRSGDKDLSNTLKIVLNSTFGKLGSPYSPFYAPDLMLGVTLSGQLTLLCLIHELEKIPGVKVISANTDGIMVDYSRSVRDQVIAVFKENSDRTGFEYEETAYRTIAMKDVNNYVAVTGDAEVVIVGPEGVASFPQKGGDLKRKGLYASSRKAENVLYLMKNPSMEVCSQLVCEYLRDGTDPADAIGKYDRIEDFLAIRSVRGGGIQPEGSVEVDDWVLVEDHGSAQNLWARQAWLDKGLVDKFVKRKSRPKPVTDYFGGEPFGRIARWYMTTESLPPLVYVSSGNKVPKSDGARLCLDLPDELPKDLDLNWYVQEAYSILDVMGVKR